MEGAYVHRIEQVMAGDGSSSSLVWIHPSSRLYLLCKCFSGLRAGLL